MLGTGPAAPPARALKGQPDAGSSRVLNACTGVNPVVGVGADPECGDTHAFGQPAGAAQKNRVGFVPPECRVLRGPVYALRGGALLPLAEVI
jgi:hypothetical protein